MTKYTGEPLTLSHRLAFNSRESDELVVRRSTARIWMRRNNKVLLSESMAERKETARRGSPEPAGTVEALGEQSK